MSRQLFKDAFSWGFLLWLIGYVLGIVLFMIVPPSMVGWVIMPFGISITVWVLLKKINNKDFQYYLLLALIWTILAIALDYFFLVQVFKPADGYYKLDVYLYYMLTFILPLVIGWGKQKRLCQQN